MTDSRARGLIVVALVLLVACEDRRAEAAANALGQGDVDAARELYASGVDPDTAVRGFTALTMAACRGSEESIALLLELGADPNLPNRRGRTPLIYAAGCANLPVVRLLLEAGADPMLPSRDGATPLSAAREARAAEIVTLLLAAGASDDAFPSASDLSFVPSNGP